MAAKRLSYDQIEAGLTLPEIEFEISEERVKHYVQAIEDFNPIYLEDEQALRAGFPRRIAPPTIGALFIMKVYADLGGQPDGTIHTQQSFKFFGPIYVGEIIRTSSRVIDKFIKRDKQYVLVETHSLNSRKELIMLGRSTFIWP